MTGAEMIAAERQRQVEVEGWTPEHDDAHADGQLNSAAICYANAAQSVRRSLAYAMGQGVKDAERYEGNDRQRVLAHLEGITRDPLGYVYGRSEPGGNLTPPQGSSGWWPWEGSDWKPDADPVRNLVKAGALIAAEIDRLQREASS